MFRQEFSISFNIDNGDLPFEKVQTIGSYRAMAKAFKAGANEDWKKARREFKGCVPKKYKDAGGVIRYNRKNNKSIAYHTDGRAWANLKDYSVTIDGIGKIAPFSVAYGLWAHTKHYHLLKDGHYFYGHYPYHYYYGSVPKLAWPTKAEGIAKEFQAKITDPGYVGKIMEGVVLNKNYELFTEPDTPREDQLPEEAADLKYHTPELTYKGSRVHKSTEGQAFRRDLNEVPLYELLAENVAGYYSSSGVFKSKSTSEGMEDYEGIPYSSDVVGQFVNFKYGSWFLRDKSFQTQRSYYSAGGRNVTYSVNSALPKVQQAMREVTPTYTATIDQKCVKTRGVYDVNWKQWLEKPEVFFKADTDENGNFLYPYTRTYGVMQTTAAQITQQANRYMITAIAGVDPTKTHTKKIVFKN